MISSGKIPPVTAPLVGSFMQEPVPRTNTPETVPLGQGEAPAETGAPMRAEKPVAAAMWLHELDPNAVHSAVLIAQEAYRNQRALEDLAMLVMVPSAPKTDVAISPRPGARGEVRPVTPGETGREGGWRR